MTVTRKRQHSPSNKRTRLLCLALLTQALYAQALSGTSTPTTLPFIAPVTAEIPSATSTLRISATIYSATSSAMSASDPRPSSSIFPGNHPPDDHDEDGTVFNYYFLFLAAFLVLFGLLGWWLHRRRKQRKAQMQQSRQHALARDLEGWAGTHRYVQGGHASHQAGHVQRQDGLDEHGEAPPPYQPKSEVTVAHTPTGGYHHQSSSPAVPLRTLSRNELGRGRPPGYSATVDTHDSQSPRP